MLNDSNWLVTNTDLLPGGTDPHILRGLCPGVTCEGSCFCAPETCSGTYVLNGVSASAAQSYQRVLVGNNEGLKGIIDVGAHIAGGILIVGLLLLL